MPLAFTQEDFLVLILKSYTCIVEKQHSVTSQTARWSYMVLMQWEIDQQATGYLSPWRSFACMPWFRCQLVSGLLFCQWPQRKSFLPGEIAVSRISGAKQNDEIWSVLWMRDTGIINDKLLSLFGGSCFNIIEFVQEETAKGSFF